jgi:leucine dehydrogenase
MEITNHNGATEYERVLFGRDDASGYRGIVAIHGTRLGPALGGARFWNYASEQEALTDALRLSRGMTYKNALAELPFGGGKSIIIGDNKRTAGREELFRAHGRFVETLGGSYLTAEDVGTTTADMESVLKETQHVAGLAHRSGDPSPVTARGVFRAMQAAARHRWGTDELAGRRVALQGCGHVGHYLTKELHEVGAKLIVTDVDRESVERVASQYGAESVEPEEIFAVEADIFAPCALGGILNDETIPQLRVEIVAGAANNQLLEARHGDALAARNILYAPDYAANAGGVINGCIELLGWKQSESRAKVEAIYDTLLEIFQRAELSGISTSGAADQLAEARLQHAYA